MSQYEPRQKRQRASSAKPTRQRNRPSSGHSTKNVNKVEFIENLYGGILGSRRQSKVPAKIGFSYGFGDESHINNTMSKGYKETEQLHEENMILKKQINHLKKEVELQRGKTEAFRRKTSQYTKNLNIQFQKEMYYTGSNANMVRGIKNQYELMKEKYTDKCKEYEDIIKECRVSSSNQDKSYIQAIEGENKKLKKALLEAIDEMRVLEHGTITSSVDDAMDRNKRYRHELKLHSENLENQVQMLKVQTQALGHSIKDRDKKISFLQKLLIEKDNGEHAARKKLKKTQRQKQQLHDSFTVYRSEKQNLINALEERANRIKDTAERQAGREILIFKNELQQKNEMIVKLEKQIAYLVTLMSYWKPLDEINQMVATRMENNSLAPEDREILLEYSVGSTMIKYKESSRQGLNPIHIEDEDNRSMTHSIIKGGSRRGSVEMNKHLLDKPIADLMTKSINLPQQMQMSEAIREPITADKRHSQNSQKCRKIHHRQILDISQTLKFRFIGFNIPIDTIRDLFDYKHDEDDILLTEEQENWKKQYINQEEVQKILCQNKYCALSEEDGRILARYLVEDSQNDYVYFDPANENLRTVVKSIIRTQIGGYEVFEDVEKVKQKALTLIRKYETNLQPALGATAPKGVISSQRLLLLFKGLGIELSQDIADYLIGQLVIESQNLSTLKYKLLFKL